MKKNIIQFTIIVLLVTSATTLVSLVNERSLLGIDDANIYMVYMRNLSQGHGFVYNIGSERIEGFTSLLYTLIGAAFYLFNAKSEILLLAFNILIITIALFTTIRFLHFYFNDQKLISEKSLLLLGLLIAIPGYFEWTTLSLMETGLWSALLILTFLHLVTYERAKSKLIWNGTFILLLILLVLCRPEAVLWGTFFIAAFIYRLYLSHFFFKEIVRKTLPACIAFLITILALTLWRMHYFGFPLPNTYYAKVSVDRVLNFRDGFAYAIKCFLDNPLLLLILIICIVVLIRRKGLKALSHNYMLVVSTGVAAITFFIPLITGGDHFYFSRFIQPTLPIIYLLLIVSIHLLNVKLRYLYTVLFILIATITPRFSVYRNLINKSSPIAHEWRITVSLRQASEELNRFFQDLPAYPTQGVLAAGGSAYTYKGTTIDLLGLNNSAMAHKNKRKNTHVLKNHASFDKDVFFTQLPDLFWYGNCLFLTGNENFNTPIEIGDMPRRTFLNIHTDSRFSQLYAAVIIRKRSSQKKLKIFALKSFVQNLDPNIYSFDEISFVERN